MAGRRAAADGGRVDPIVECRGGKVYNWKVGGHMHSDWVKTLVCKRGDV